MWVKVGRAMLHGAIWALGHKEAIEAILAIVEQTEKAKAK